MKIITVFIVALTLVGMAGVTASSAPAPQGVRSDQPIQIKSNELSSDGAGKIATFIGSVVARQADVTIYCDRLVIYYGDQTEDQERDISKVEAFGNVRVIQGNRQGHGGKATFDNKAGTIVLEENPRVSQGSDTVTGKVITFYVDDDKSLVTSGPDRRVEAVINPKGDEKNAGKKP